MPSRRPFTLLAALAVAACGDALGPADAAGTYHLQLADPPAADPGYRASAGTLVLGADGRAAWHVEYAQAGRGAVAYDYRGTFVLRRDSVHLALTQPSARTEGVWRPAGVRQGALLTFRYGHPADGPDIIEVYRRD